MFGLTIPVPAHSVETNAVTGEVMGSTTWSETSVQGGAASGGINSIVTQRDRFFLKTSDQRQREIDLHGIGFAAMDGHRVTAIYGGGNSQPMHLVGLHNHTTQRKAEIPHGFNRMSGSNIHGCVLLLLLIALPAWLFFTGSLLDGFFLGLGALGPLLALASLVLMVFYTRRVTSKRKATIEAIRASIRRHVSEAEASPH